MFLHMKKDKKKGVAWNEMVRYMFEIHMKSC